MSGGLIFFVASWAVTVFPKTADMLHLAHTTETSHVLMPINETFLETGPFDFGLPAHQSTKSNPAIDIQKWSSLDNHAFIGPQ